MKVPAPAPEPSITPVQDIPVDNEEIPTNMDVPQNNEMPFGKEKFDAGIDVNEDEDPKKYIEKLTGKLAQKLRDYNESSDDTDTNKFVINSLIPAAIPEMSENDAQDVIKKVKDNIGQVSDENNLDNQNDSQIPPEEIPSEDVTQESKENEIDDLISELFRHKKTNKNSKNKNPFKPKTFK